MANPINPVSSKFPHPRDAMMVTIARWEGLYGASPDDPGNWVILSNGSRRLVGTMRGVTAEVAARWLKISTDDITPEILKAAITLEVAGDIALARFYKGLIDPLRWQAAADVVTDFGWGAGPGQAIKSTERDFLGLDNADFRFDTRSISAWAAMDDRDGMAAMVWRFYDVRERFYDLICRVNPTLQQFRQGWHNRAYWQTPKSPEWWGHWSGASTDDVVRAANALPSRPLPSRVISKGMHGSDVVAIQKALIAAGYPLPKFGADGDFGDETEEAVLKFQADKKMALVDGWVGDKTRAALGIN